MNLMKVSVALLAITSLSGCIIVANSPSYANVHLEQELSLDASDLSALDISAGSGTLKVQGRADISEISVVADIYVSKEQQNDYDLTLIRVGNKAELSANMHSTSGFWVGNSPRIDLVVTVPDKMMLDIDDGSGDLYVNHFNASVNVEDGSGEMEIRNINGAVTVDDNSGELTIEHIVGNLTIEDGSGEMYLNNIQGNVVIDDDSGNITAKNITGSASLIDGSGDLSVSKVGGVVTIDDGSGDITVDDAGGLTIVESGSGDLNVNNVKGSTKIDS